MTRLGRRPRSRRHRLPRRSPPRLSRRHPLPGLLPHPNLHPPRHLPWSPWRRCPRRSAMVRLRPGRRHCPGPKHQRIRLWKSPRDRRRERTPPPPAWLPCTGNSNSPGGKCRLPPARNKPPGPKPMPLPNRRPPRPGRYRNSRSISANYSRWPKTNWRMPAWRNTRRLFSARCPSRPRTPFPHCFTRHTTTPAGRPIPLCSSMAKR